MALRDDQQDAAKELQRNFLIVMGVAFLGEVLMRVFPEFLRGIPERVWIEWLLVSLIGVSAYLLWNIAIWFKDKDADFLAFRPWYRSTAAKGPIIALVVLLALTNINFQVGTSASQAGAGDSTFNFGVNFGEASESVLLIVAFILGFYSRLAHDALGNIARFIFKDLYDKTYKQEQKLTK